MRHAWLLALAGCFSPKFPEGLACGDGKDPCPPGQLCDQGVCVKLPSSSADATLDTPDGPPDDVDADGILNADDNCPDRGNPLQSDEDIDGLGDVCDPCPPAVNNNDPDGDGVGGGCDPHPFVGGDRVVLFEGFNEPLAGDWISQGNWINEGGTMRIVTVNDEIAFLASPIVASMQSTTSAGFVTDPVDPTFQNRGISLSHFSPTDSVGVSCVAALENTDNSRHLATIDVGTAANITTMPVPWADETPFNLINARLDATTYHCGISKPAASVDVTYAEPGVPLYAGVRTRSISGRVQWLMYVESP